MKVLLGVAAIVSCCRSTRARGEGQQHAGMLGARDSHVFEWERHMLEWQQSRSRAFEWASPLLRMFLLVVLMSLVLNVRRKARLRASAGEK